MPIELTPALRSQIENTIRGLTIDAVEAAGIGHVGAPLGLARPALQLWDRHLRFDPSDPAWPLRDRFVLSAGHASMLLYSLLHLYEYDLPLDEIRRFRQLHSKTPGHPEFGETPGVEVTTGPLGQGFGHAVGMALAGQLTRRRFGQGGEGPGQHWIYAIASDGDLMEGVSYESASLAGHLKLDNLIVLYDDNRVTIDGPTSLCFSEDVRGRFAAQGWHVQAIEGEDVVALDGALAAARAASGRPSLVILRTTIGQGSPWAGQSKAHGGPFGAEVARAAKQNLGIPLEPLFHVAGEVRAYLHERAGAKRFERMLADERARALGRRASRAARPPGSARETARCPAIWRSGSWPGSRARPTPRASTRALRSAASRSSRQASWSAARRTSRAPTTPRSRESRRWGRARTRSPARICTSACASTRWRRSRTASPWTAPSRRSAARSWCSATTCARACVSRR